LTAVRVVKSCEREQTSKYDNGLVPVACYSVRTALILCLTPDESDVNISDRFTVEMLLRGSGDYAYLDLLQCDVVSAFNLGFFLPLNLVKQAAAPVSLPLSVTLLFALSWCITQFRIKFRGHCVL
jgi:hypothetical protein